MVIGALVFSSPPIVSAARRLTIKDNIEAGNDRFACHGLAYTADAIDTMF